MKKKKLSLEEMSIFAKELSLIVNSDVSTQEGLDLIAADTNNKTTIGLINSLKQSLNKRMSFYAAIENEREYLSEYFIQMVKIGNESGNIDIVLDRISKSYEKEVKLANKTSTAVTYPLILSMLMIIVTILLITTIIPLFNEILISFGGEIPVITSMIIDIGFFLNSYLLYIVGGVVLLYIGYRLLCYNTKFVKFIDKFVFVIPIKKDIEKNYIAVNFTRNLAMLLKSGFSISVAISNCVPLIENLYIREKINTAANRLKNGESFSDVFQDLDLFKKVYIRLFNIAYKTGKLDEVLSESSVKLEEELDSNLSKFISFIEPAMIIFISIIIGVILISLIFPVIDIMNAIG